MYVNTTFISKSLRWFIYLVVFFTGPSSNLNENGLKNKVTPTIKIRKTFLYVSVWLDTSCCRRSDLKQYKVLVYYNVFLDSLAIFAIFKFEIHTYLYKFIYLSRNMLAFLMHTCETSTHELFDVFDLIPVFLWLVDVIGHRWTLHKQF